jgi:hypothetical protein
MPIKITDTSKAERYYQEQNLQQKKNNMNKSIYLTMWTAFYQSRCEGHTIKNMRIYTSNYSHTSCIQTIWANILDLTFIKLWQGLCWNIEMKPGQSQRQIKAD